MNRLFRMLVPTLALGGACAAALALEGPTEANPTQRALHDFNSCAKPVWPHAALEARRTGRVTLRFLVDAHGAVKQAEIAKSSGHPSLDVAARDGIAKCRFQPAQANGKAVQAWTQAAYEWMLE